jgi:hypothetical protein
VPDGAGGGSPVPPSTSVSAGAPPAIPVDDSPARTEIQGIGLHLDPTMAPPATSPEITLGDLPSPWIPTFTPAPAATPVDTSANPGAPPAAPIGSAGSSTTLRTIHPGDRPNVELIATNTLKGTADRSNEVPLSPSIVGYTSQTPLIALVGIVAAVALAWWLVKRGSL